MEGLSKISHVKKRKEIKKNFRRSCKIKIIYDGFKIAGKWFMVFVFLSLYMGFFINAPLFTTHG